jgi:hypothetical protein
MGLSRFPSVGVALLVRCCGGLFATTSTALSKRDHASDSGEGISPLESLAMQPLSRVKPDAVTEWGNPNTMSFRPELAAKVAACITHWSEIETHLGAFLGLLLHANQKAAVAIYSGLDNRAAQLRAIESAAEATLKVDHFDVISVLLTVVVRPVMRDRDKLAHWAWGYSPDLQDALLIAEPGYTLEGLMSALTLYPGIDNAAIPTDFSRIYVVKAGDLTRIRTRSIEAKDNVRLAMSSVWEHNPPSERARLLLQLTNVPSVRAGLDRLARDRQKTQATPPPSPPPEPNGTA